MNNILTAFSYICAITAGICLAGGIAVLTGGRADGNA